MKIDLYTLCWNEIDILPFVIDYWKRFVNKAYVYDNGSTDGSVEYLRQYDWIEVIPFESDGMNDIIQRDIKNNCWKNYKADFVCVCDMDELIFSNDLESELQYMKDNCYNVLGTKWYCLCNDTMPVYTEGKLLHQLCDKFYLQDINRTHPHLGKFMIFDPNKISDMGYSVGCHIANPIPSMKLYVSDKVYTIHIDKGFGEEYFINRRKIMNKRLSQTNRLNGFCFQYGYSEEKSRQEYRDNQAKSFNLNDIIKVT